jgi:phosphoketolase
MNEPASIPPMATALSPDPLKKMVAYRRAANYLSVGQIYLQENRPLETSLPFAHIKPLARKSPDPSRQSLTAAGE